MGPFAEDFSGVILYDPPPKFAVQTTLWLQNPGTRDPRWDPFQSFSIVVLLDSGSGDEN